MPEVGADTLYSRTIRSNDDLCRFLLPNSANAQRLTGYDLSWEVGIVGVTANRHADEWIMRQHREMVDEKTEQDAEKYQLREADRAVLKQLYTGFSQSMLNRDGQEFAARIALGETSEILSDEDYPPDNLRLKGMEYLHFRNKETFELAHINTRGNESQMEQQTAMQVFQVSPQLLGVILGEFSRVSDVAGENRQLRKSPEKLFRFTVLQGPAKLAIPQDTTRKVEVFAVPIHRVGQFKGQ